MKAVILALVGLMALAGGAQATILTSPAGTQAGAGTKVHASGTITLDKNPANITCAKSTLEGEVSDEGSSGTTVLIPLSKFTLEECGSNTFTVVNGGTLEVHATEGANGTITSTGATITLLTHGVVGTIHCIYITSATDIGSFTGSSTTKGTAKLDISESPIPRESTDFGCGSTSELTGSYTFTSPDYLDID